MKNLTLPHAIVIAALVIGACHLFAGRYEIYRIGDSPRSLLVDGLFGTVSVCYPYPDRGCEKLKDRNRWWDSAPLAKDQTGSKLTPLDFDPFPEKSQN